LTSAPALPPPPRIDVEPRQRRNDAQQLAVSILADRSEEERIELSPDQRRHRGVNHFVSQFSLRQNRPKAGCVRRRFLRLGSASI
jgi:hypothetical protein